MPLFRRSLPLTVADGRSWPTQAKSKPEWSTRTLLAVFALLMLAAASAHAQNTYTVNSTADTNTGSGSLGTLRWAIAQVNADTSDTGTNSDIIDFSLTGSANTITLLAANGALPINRNVNITGPGATALTISGGGGVTVFLINSSATVSLSGLTIANGNAASGGGLINSGTLTVTDCVFSNNSSGHGGGGIENLGSMTINNSTISGNSSNSTGGGGIYNSGTLTVTNSSISGNMANNGGYGSGIYVNSGTVTLTNSTVSGNSAADGGGIYVSGGSATLTNSIVAGNTDSANPGDDCSGCTQNGSNLVSTSASTITAAQLKLGPLENNGGPTETMLPLLSSPALNAGSSSTLATDQRGFPRPTGSGVVSDLGAVQSGYLIVTTTADSTDASSVCDGSDTCSLRDAITLANSFGFGDIVFAYNVTGTITLGGTLPALAGAINMTGPGANLLTVSGNHRYRVFFINSGATVSLSGLTMANGYASPSGSGLGGGINNNGTLTVTNSTLYGNVISEYGFTYGGGIFNQGTLTITNSTISGNTAKDLESNFCGSGGGIASSGPLTITNSTISGNATSGSNGCGNNGVGGGIDNGGPLTILNSTITGNTAQNGGGGIDGNTKVTLTNSIVAGNTTTANAGDDCDRCGNQNTSNLINTTTTNPAINPQLGPLAYNGASQTVQTMLPLPGSLAIQAGNPALLPAGLTTDQRGLPRTINSLLDLGAVQTNYTSVQFVQQPSNTSVNAILSPVTVSVIESGASAANIAVPLTFSGSGTLSGTTTATTTAPGVNGAAAVATYSNLSVSAGGNGDTLNVTLPISPAGSTNPLPALTVASNTFNISQSQPTLTFTPPASAPYSTTPMVLNATLSVTGPTISYTVDAGPGVISGNQLTLTGAGTIVVEATSTASNGYAAANAVGYITVTPVSLTISASNASRFYGATNPAFTGSVTGTLAGDSFTESFFTHATTTSNAGSYAIVPTVTGAHLAGYSVTTVDGTLTVNAATTTTSVSASMGSAIAGSSVTLTAAVLSGGSPVTSGTVTFTSGGASIGAAQLNAQGQATLTTTLLPVGVDSINASYTTNGNFAASTTTTSATVTVSAVVPPAPLATTTTLAASSSTITAGSNVTLTATVTAGGSPVVGGLVTFASGNTSIGAAATNASGQAVLTTPLLPVGTDAIQASFVATANDLSSQSTLQTVTVTAPTTPPPTQLATKTTLIASASSITQGAIETLTANVTDANGAVVNGTVIFYDGSTSVGAGQLNAQGQAVLTTTLLPVGVDSITASYVGSANDLTSTSSLASVTVSAATTPGTPSYTITANPSSLTIAAGKTGTTTLTITPTGGYTGTLGLGCGSLPANTQCAFTQSGTAISTVTMTGNDAVITITLTISTNVATAMNVLPSLLQTPGARPATLLAASKTPTPSQVPLNPILPALAFWGPGSLAGLATFWRKRKLSKKQFRFLQLGLLVLLTGALAAGISGCGGSSSTNSLTQSSTVTPAGTSMVVITLAPAVGSATTLNLSVTITG